jgi:hypothetical protein
MHKASRTWRRFYLSGEPRLEAHMCLLKLLPLNCAYRLCLAQGAGASSLVADPRLTADGASWDLVLCASAPPQCCRSAAWPRRPSGQRPERWTDRRWPAVRPGVWDGAVRVSVVLRPAVGASAHCAYGRGGPPGSRPSGRHARVSSPSRAARSPSGPDGAPTYPT